MHLIERNKLDFLVYYLNLNPQLEVNLLKPYFYLQLNWGNPLFYVPY